MADLPDHPVTRQEMYLSRLAGENTTLPNEPLTREEMYLEGDIARVEKLQADLEELKNNPDVADIVATYADLQAYDTSKLTDKDIIRVLQDETHDGQSTYYRYSTSTHQFTYVGTVGDYYTKSQTNTLLDAKQDTLTAGTNIQIAADGKTISATDTTYSDFTGTDGTAAGTHGLVPAPATTDAGKYLKADGTWDSVQAGPTVVQTTGNSTTDVMSQDATTKMIYKSSSTLNQLYIPVTFNSNSYIRIGGNTEATGQGGVAIGFSAQAGTSSTHYGAVAIGTATYGSHPKAGATSAIAIGEGSQTTTQGVFTIGGLNSFNRGYNNSHYRLLTGLYDPQADHDAATKGYVDSNVGLVTLSYGSSTWSDFLTAYNAGKIVYCRASSNADPSTGTQTRMAFMAYINNPTEPTSVEFQYVRSVSTKSAAQQCDQVFVYKLTSTNGGTWTVETRDMASSIAAGTNMSISYANGTLTLNATGGGGGSSITNFYVSGSDILINEQVYKDEDCTITATGSEVADAYLNGPTRILAAESNATAEIVYVDPASRPFIFSPINYNEYYSLYVDSNGILADYDA